MNKTQKDLIAFFQNEEGWDKIEYVTDTIAKVKGLEDKFADEIGLTDGNNKEFMLLSDFAEQFFDLVLESVCNVIESAV